MREKKIYTCELCNTDYNSKAEALQCEKNHKRLIDAQIFADYHPKSMIPGGVPYKIRVKFLGVDRWIEYRS